MFLLYFDIFPGAKLLDHMVALFLIFSQILHSYNPTKDSVFLTSSLAYVFSCLFDDGHSNRHEVTAHCAFALHFLND